MSKYNEIKEKDTGGRDRIAVILYAVYLIFVVIAFVIIFRIIYIQYVYKPDPTLINELRPRNTKQVISPSRGAIIAQDGRLLALSTPMYQIYMDCSVQKDEFASKDKEEGEKLEKEWLKKAEKLSRGLSNIFGDMAADGYYDLSSSGRRKNNRYLKLGHKIDHENLQKIKDLPLFNEGQYKGGLIVEKEDTRQYPYGSLARRVIGYVKDNSRSNGNNHIGLEGAFDYTLHGKGGYEWLKQTDGRKKILNKDSLVVEPQDGMDLRTTLNIDIQDIADNALRKQIADIDNIE